MGAPSHNFNFLPEYAYSGAILKVDLSAIGTTTYDLPTLVDEDHPGLVGPFGGDFGKHQAKITPSSPVQVYAPGFRNPFSLVRTRGRVALRMGQRRECRLGRHPDRCRSDGSVLEREQRTRHPPERQPAPHHRSGLLRRPRRTRRAETRRTRSTPRTRSRRSPPSNPKECDARTPTTNGSIANTTSATTGMAEYTTANLGGQLDGDLITATWQGSVLRDHLSADGTKVLSADVLFSNVATHRHRRRGPERHPGLSRNDLDAGLRRRIDSRVRTRRLRGADPAPMQRRRLHDARRRPRRLHQRGRDRQRHRPVFRGRRTPRLEPQLRLRSQRSERRQRRAARRLRPVRDRRKRRAQHRGAHLVRVAERCTRQSVRTDSYAERLPRRSARSRLHRPHVQRRDELQRHVRPPTT